MLKVLAIDDEAPIRQWLEFCVNKLDGFQIVGIAANGKEALQIFQREKPDIVVTDIEMPGMSGLEMLRQMQLTEAEFYAIVLTSHEDFSYAREALHLGTAEYILKTEISDVSLAEVLRKAAAHIQEHSQGSYIGYEHGERNHFLQSVALNKLSKPLQEAELRGYGIALMEENIVAIDIFHGDAAGNSQELLRNLQGMKNLTTFSLGFDHTIGLANLIVEGDRVDAAMAHLAEQLSLLIGSQNCYAGISNLGKQYTELTAMIRTARLRCSLCFYHPEQHTFWQEEKLQEEIEHGEACKISFTKELLAQDYQKAIETKNAMAEDLGRAQPTDTEQVKKLVAFVVTSLLHFTKDDIPEIEAQVADVNKKIQNAQSMIELLQIMSEVFTPFEEKANLKKDFSPAIMEAILYMEEHYGEKITLTMVSNTISFSPEYFSRLFMKETGVNFVVYLNNIRMKNAVKLLETTNLKVYEIAEKVGYSSLSYFSTAFKKKFGKNPCDYQMDSGK